MKKTILLLIALLVMITWYPLLVITGWICHFTVTITYPLVTLLVLTAGFVAVSVYLVNAEEKTVNVVTGILSGLLPYFSAAHLLVWTLENPGFLTFILAFTWSALAFILSLFYGKQSLLHGCLTGISLVILVPLVFFMGLLSFVSLFPIGHTTVVQTLYSPEGTYYAELIDSDQGALGGDTIVDVYTTSAKLDLFFLEISKDPQTVYFGDWGEFKNMKLEWESEQVLLINGAPNPIH